MAQLSYRFAIEELQESQMDTVLHTCHLPHEKEIKEFIQKTWNDCKDVILDAMDESIKDHIDSLELQFPKQTDGTVYGYIYINPKPGLQWIATRRQAVWNSLDAQMADGFGECIDNHIIHEDTTTNTTFMLSL